MDALDRDILLALQQDARQPRALLAKQLGLSLSDFRRRVCQLEREGVILGYRADIAPKALGLGLQAFVTVRLEARHRNHIEGFERGIGGVREVRACYNVAGRCDYVLNVAAKDLGHLERLVRTDIATLPGAARPETLLVLRQVKTDAGWPTRGWVTRSPREDSLAC